MKNEIIASDNERAISNAVFGFNKSILRISIVLGTSFLFFVIGLITLFYNCYSDIYRTITIIVSFFLLSVIFIILLIIVNRAKRNNKIQINKSIFRYRSLLLILFPVIIYIFNIIFKATKSVNVSFDVLLNDTDTIIIINLITSVILLALSLPCEYSKVFSTDDFFTRLKSMEHFYGNADDKKRKLINEQAYFALSQLKFFWNLTLIAWILSYSFQVIFPRADTYFLLEKLNLPISRQLYNSFYNLVLDVFYLLSTVLFTFFVMILAKPTIKITRIHSNENAEGKIVLKTKFPPLLKNAIICSAILLLIFDITGKFFYTNFYFQTLVYVCLGLFGGLLINVFTGRIDSKFINLNGFVIVLLYLYAYFVAFIPIIQISQYIIPQSTLIESPYINNDVILLIQEIFSKTNTVFHVLEIFITNISIIYKLAFFYVLFFLIKTNRLFLYFIRMKHYLSVVIKNDKKLFETNLYL